jgi:hypothetical protein
MTPLTGTRFVYSLDNNILTVQHVDHETDHCAGQNLVKTAWFHALTELGLTTDGGERVHGGGFYQGRVKAEQND